MPVLICGSIAYDTIMVFPERFRDHILADKTHMINVSFMVPELHRNFGGTAGNIAYTLRGIGGQDRKSTRLNSSHVAISYAVFCLKKKKAHKCTSPVNKRGLLRLIIPYHDTPLIFLATYSCQKNYTHASPIPSTLTFTSFSIVLRS